MRSLRSGIRLFFGILLTAVPMAMAAEEPLAEWRHTVQHDQAEITCAVAWECTLDPASVQIRLNGQLLANPPGTATAHGTVYDSSRLWQWRGKFTPPLQSLTVTFQGCRAGLCLPPETADLLASGDQTVQADPALPPALTEALTHWQTLAKGEGWMNAAAFSNWLRAAFGENGPARMGATPGGESSGGFWALFWLILLGGLGLNFTPCVLPMIPVNLAIIGAGCDVPGSSGRPGWRGFRRGLAYGAGIALVYGILGGAAALGGASFGALNSRWWFQAAIAAILLLLGLSLLSPRGLDLSRFAGSWVDSVRAFLPPWLGAFFMGGVAALLAGACVAPVVIGVVVVAADLYAAGNRAGLLLPLALGTAMALPWPLAGAGLAVLPAPGRWMVWVKRGFALLILLAAGYFVLQAYRQYPVRRDRPESGTALAAALQKAAAAPDPVLICFSASWCKNCAAMERRTFPDREVQSLLAAHRVRIVECPVEDLTAPANRALLSRWHLRGLPAWVLLLPQK